MTFSIRPSHTIVAIAFALITMLGLTGCAPAVTSPVGVWEAIGDDNGTLTIKNDGTFTMTDASFNPLQYRATQDDFRGSGVWETFSDAPRLPCDSARPSTATSQSSLGHYKSISGPARSGSKTRNRPRASSSASRNSTVATHTRGLTPPTSGTR